MKHSTLSKELNKNFMFILTFIKLKQHFDKYRNKYPGKIELKMLFRDKTIDFLNNCRFIFSFFKCDYSEMLCQSRLSPTLCIQFKIWYILNYAIQCIMWITHKRAHLTHISVRHKNINYVKCWNNFI